MPSNAAALFGGKYWSFIYFYRARVLTETDILKCNGSMNLGYLSWVIDFESVNSKCLFSIIILLSQCNVYITIVTHPVLSG